MTGNITNGIVRLVEHSPQQESDNIKHFMSQKFKYIAVKVMVSNEKS